MTLIFPASAPLLATSCAAFLVAAAAPSYAQDNPQPLGEDYCLRIEGIGDMIAKFDRLKPEKRDTVGPELSLIFEVQEGEAMPERVELRDGDTVIPITFNDKNHNPGFIDQMRSVSNAASLCILDPARAERTHEDRGYLIDIKMAVQFKDTPGTHTLRQIEDGIKDGRAHFKKMAGAMGFMVPKFNYIAVSGDDDAAPPRLWATAKGVDLAEPEFKLYDGARIVSVKALKKMGADGVRIENGYYRMSPSPDVKTVAKFMGGE